MTKFQDQTWRDIGDTIFTADEAETLTKYAETNEDKAKMLQQLEHVVITYVAICSMLDDGGLEVGIDDNGKLLFRYKGAE